MAILYKTGICRILFTLIKHLSFLLLIEVKVLVYSLVLAFAAIHMTLQVKHYLLVRELRRTFNEEFLSAAHFAYL